MELKSVDTKSVWASKLRRRETFMQFQKRVVVGTLRTAEEFRSPSESLLAAERSQGQQKFIVSTARRFRFIFRERPFSEAGNRVPDNVGFPILALR